MTAKTTPEQPDLRVQDISPARLHGEACFECGTTEPPLHPDGTIELPDGPDLVRVYDIVRCTPHLAVDR